MASLNLRWVCAPLLLASSVAAADETYIPPSIPYTETYLPVSDFGSNLKACRSGIEFIWGTPSDSPSDCTLDEGGLRCLAVTTGKWCGSLSDNNKFLTNSPSAGGLTDDETLTIESMINSVRDDLSERYDESRDLLFNFNSYSRIDAERSRYNQGYYTGSAISTLSRAVELLSDGLTDLHDYSDLAKAYYASSLSAASDISKTNIKINGLASSLDTEIARIESEIARIESEIESDDYDIQDILDSIESLESGYQSLNGGLNYAFERIGVVSSQIYTAISDLETRINDRFSNVYSALFSEVGDIYNYINDEISGVSAGIEGVLNDAQAYTDAEMSTLTDAIEASNAGIASSIDSQTGEITGAIDGQTGEIVGAIDGQTSTLGSKLDGIFSNLFDFSGKFDSFSDYIKGKIGDFEGSLTDGLPSGADVDSQTGELSSLIDDKDFSRSYSIEFGAKQCPEPISVYMSTLKRDIEISFELFCQFADIARLFVLASAYIMALMITMGVSRRA